MERVTVAKGAVVQIDYSDYKVLCLNEAPDVVEVHYTTLRGLSPPAAPFMPKNAYRSTSWITCCHGFIRPSVFAGEVTLE